MKLIPLFEERNITDTIKRLVKLYKKKHSEVETASDINYGLCIDFADDLTELVDGDILHTNMFCTDDEIVMEDWGKDVIEFEGNDFWWNREMLNKYGWPKNNKNYDLKKKGFDLPNHSWTFHKGKHYDADCAEGVDNWTELPLFNDTFR